MVHDRGDGYFGKLVPREPVFAIEQVNYASKQWSGRREFVEAPTNDPGVDGKGFRICQAGPGIAPTPKSKFLRSHGDAGQTEKTPWNALNGPAKKPTVCIGRDWS